MVQLVKVQFSVKSIFCSVQCTSNNCTVLYFRSGQAASEFHAAYNGLPYNNIESDICSVSIYLKQNKSEKHIWGFYVSKKFIF